MKRQSFTSPLTKLEPKTKMVEDLAVMARNQFRPFPDPLPDSPLPTIPSERMVVCGKCGKEHRVIADNGVKIEVRCECGQVIWQFITMKTLE